MRLNAGNWRLGLAAGLWLGLGVTGQGAQRANATPVEVDATGAQAHATSTQTGALTQAGAVLTEVRIGARLDPRSAQVADRLAHAIKSDTLSRTDQRNPEHAGVYLFLAAGARELTIVEGALTGMARTWSSNGTGRRPKADKDYQAVIAARLADKNEAVRVAALGATPPLLSTDKPHEPTLKAVLDIVVKDTPTARIAAMLALGSVPDYQIAGPRPGPIKARVAKAVAASLTASDPLLLAAGLDRLYRVAYPAHPERNAQLTAARKHTEHASPAVRGSALRLAASLMQPGDHSAWMPVFAAGLRDPEPFVRASAADGVGRAKLEALAHEVIKLVEDAADASATLQASTPAGGRKPTALRLSFSTARVGEVALHAMRDLAAGRPDAWKAESFIGGQAEARRRAAADNARKWYEANKGRLPPAPKAANEAAK